MSGGGGGRIWFLPLCMLGLYRMSYFCNWKINSLKTIMLALLIFFFLIYLFFSWRIIALQNFVVFCQTSTWISHKALLTLKEEKRYDGYSPYLTGLFWLPCHVDQTVKATRGWRCRYITLQRLVFKTGIDSRSNEPQPRIWPNFYNYFYEAK